MAILSGEVPPNSVLTCLGGNRIQQHFPLLLYHRVEHCVLCKSYQLCLCTLFYALSEIRRNRYKTEKKIKTNTTNRNSGIMPYKKIRQGHCTLFKSVCVYIHFFG